MLPAILTPILNFLNEYEYNSRLVRLHMPGHKGRTYLGVEPFDITEIDGADVLYCPEGIIAESEAIASQLFGSGRTVYSCGGSSQCIFTTAWLLVRYARDNGLAPLVLAARNVHQAFVSALAQTGLDVAWYCPEGATPLACPIDVTALETHLRGMPIRPIALYITSPDYLGNIQPVAEIADLCHRYGVLLVVDNAHGAYLHYLPTPLHPLDLGADIVCDSAHKTLNCLTGAAYLHFGKACPAYFADNVKETMLTVASTSPSYLIMASLDRANASLASTGYRARMANMAEAVQAAKTRLSEVGWQCIGDEPLKLTLYAPSMGHSGKQLSFSLYMRNIMVEYADAHYLILMMSADTPSEHFARAVEFLLTIKKGDYHPALPLLPSLPPRVLSVRDAYLAPREWCPIEDCAGRTLAHLHVSCPPAVPPVIAGECLTEAVVDYLRARGYERVEVVKP